MWTYHLDLSLWSLALFTPITAIYPLGIRCGTISKHVSSIWTQKAQTTLWNWMFTIMTLIFDKLNSNVQRSSKELQVTFSFKSDEKESVRVSEIATPQAVTTQAYFNANIWRLCTEMGAGIPCQEIKQLEMLIDSWNGEETAVISRESLLIGSAQ